MNWKIKSQLYDQKLSQALLYKEAGKVIQSVGMLFEARLSGVSIGSLCEVVASQSEDGSIREDARTEAEVIGFRGKEIFLMPFDEIQGVNSDSLVILKSKTSTVSVGDGLLGRVIDSRGAPLDNKGPLFDGKGNVEERGLYHRPSHPLSRQLVKEPLDLGIKAINGLLTTGKGQRVGIMAGSGVGKSILLGMMARNTKADVNVIALVGERGREVREFIENDLGPEGMKRSVIVVATSDKSPLLRMRAAYLATTVAEYFRDQGKDVLLMMDSVTRFCMAQREIGLSMGEPPATKGYTPSVFSTLPKLLERAGTGTEKGSITGIYTVLVEGDDADDPIADSVRAILDGHIVLSRKIAQRNQYPAIDILQSTSRVMRAVVSQEHLEWANKLKDWLAAYGQAEDLINIGAYVRGSNPKVDQAMAVIDKIQNFLKQRIDEKCEMSEVLAIMHSMIRHAESAMPSQSRGEAKATGSQVVSKIKF